MSGIQTVEILSKNGAQTGNQMFFCPKKAQMSETEK
jgi:hypothetical protein